MKTQESMGYVTNPVLPTCTNCKWCDKKDFTHHKYVCIVGSFRVRPTASCKQFICTVITRGVKK
jgi:hypothetical protein